MPFLTRPRRPRRSGEWTEAKTVTFIVTLAASRSVTLAAARAGISRKSAYALKSRDPAFAASWNAALAAGRSGRRREPDLSSSEGDKASEVSERRKSFRQGDRFPADKHLDFDAILRDRFFEDLAANRADSVARSRPVP